MNLVFYIAAAVAVFSTVMVITRAVAVHSLLYLVVSLLAVSVTFFVLGAPFAAMLEVIIYAGAIMVLFVFVVMLLNLGAAATEQEREWLNPKVWCGPAVLAIILLVEVIYMLSGYGHSRPAPMVIQPKAVSVALFGPYVLVIELASMLLLSGLVGAYHLGRRDPAPEKEGQS